MRGCGGNKILRRGKETFSNFGVCGWDPKRSGVILPSMGARVIVIPSPLGAKIKTKVERPGLEMVVNVHQGDKRCV